MNRRAPAPMPLLVGNHSLGNAGVNSHHTGPHRPEALRAADARANGKLAWVQGLNSGPGMVEAPVSMWPGAAASSQMRAHMPGYHQPQPEHPSPFMHHIMQFLASALYHGEAHQYGPPMMNPGPPLNMPIPALPQAPRAHQVPPMPGGPGSPQPMSDAEVMSTLARMFAGAGYVGNPNFPTKPER